MVEAGPATNKYGSIPKVAATGKSRILVGIKLACNCICWRNVPVAQYAGYCVRDGHAGWELNDGHIWAPPLPSFTIGM